ncbi:serine hydrolase [Undibacterium sp. FT147W]|uniref:Serine hydrolase n=1 Tax=Undibacterium rivi TaxID=2828729 RepID=A0ABS5GY69_9BURK|nr:M56 family metallopeptidase [Undibacterium rivi]MBR7791401.1 serine hydrolase [Undibacterium rivi]
MISADIMTRSMSEVLGWPLLNFVWQGALIASISAILFALCRNARPHLRYLIACVAMLLCLLWPVLSIVQQWQAPQTVSLEAALQMATNTAVALDLVWVKESAFVAGIGACLPLIVSVWSLGVAIMMLRLGLGLLWVHKLGTQHAKGSLADASMTWQCHADRLANKFGIQRQVRLQFRQQLFSPITYGCFKPVILMPASLLSGMSYDMIEALLAHELGHIKRWDYAVNLLQNLVLSLLFYHPAVWWLSRRINAERELIADDLAISVVGHARPLACALQALDKLESGVLYRPGLAANGGDLLSRIRHLIRPDAQPWHWKMASPVLGIGMALLLLMQMPIMATADATMPEHPAMPTAIDGDANTANTANNAAPRRTVYVRTQSEHVLVMEEKTGQILMDKDADTVVPIASLSKLMTAMLIIDAGLDRQEKITITKDDAAVWNTRQIMLKPGQVLTRQSLLELALTASSNIAAKALARTYPGGEPAFTDALQKKISQLKLQQTQLVEATGISTQNRSSAKDIARLVMAAAAYPELSRLSSRSEGAVFIDGTLQKYQSSNALTANQNWNISLSKTGYSKAAGRCLAMRMNIGGKPVIMVLLNARNLDARDSDVMHIRAAMQATTSS